MKSTKKLKLKIISPHSDRQQSPSKTSQTSQQILLPSEESVKKINTCIGSKKGLQISLSMGIRGTQQLERCISEQLLIEEYSFNNMDYGMFTIRQASNEQEDNSLGSYLKRSSYGTKFKPNQDISIQQFSTIKPQPLSIDANQMATSSSKKHKNKEEQQILESLMNLKEWKICGEEDSTLVQTISQLGYSVNHLLPPQIRPWNERDQQQQDEIVQEQQFQQIAQEKSFPNLQKQGNVPLYKMKMICRKNTTLKPGQKVKSQLDLFYDCSQEELDKIMDILRAQGIEIKKKNKIAKTQCNQQQKHRKKGGIRMTPKIYRQNFITQHLVTQLHKQNQPAF